MQEYQVCRVALTKYLVRVYKRSGRTAYVRHKWSGRTSFDSKNGPTRAKLVLVINVNAIKAKPLDTTCCD